jgi:hypothetical protein
MKKVEIEVYVLNVTDSDGYTCTYLYQTRQEAIDHLYANVSEDWDNCFEEDNIDDYETEEAINHYYEDVDSRYTIERETVSYPLMELQDRISKAMGLSTHG